ncbi:MAG: T9SS type A sorting domain-containing protein, partial [Candidatus Marinimicrobia bacterium]|nr:T9SS type A sorting domain-containing protein [Candidatus Neomarinimicrobiota bacterium]
VYVVASTNGYFSGGGDIVVMAINDATTKSELGPADMDWVVHRWVTTDGNDLPDIGVDVAYNPTEATLDVFWSGIGAEGYEAQFFPAHLPPAAIDAQAQIVSIGLPDGDTDELKVDVNEGDVIGLYGIIKNNGTDPLAPIPTTISITDSGGVELYTQTVNAAPLGAGTTSSNIFFGDWTVNTSRQDLVLSLEVTSVDDEATYNDVVSTSFFVYPSKDEGAAENLQDTTYTQFPTTDAATGTAIITGEGGPGNWFRHDAFTGGWTVVDSSNGTFGDLRDSVISTWMRDEPTGDEDNWVAYVAFTQGVRGDTLDSQIDPPAEWTEADSAYAQPQNELLYSPVYSISGTGSYALEWDDDIDGTDDPPQFPLWAKVQYSTDDGTTWGDVYSRVKTTEDVTNAEGINTTAAFVSYDLSTALAGATAVQFRYWWYNPANNAEWADWTVDNVYFVGDIILEAKATSQTLPEHYALAQNYPNPFNPVTRINYEMPVAGDVRIEVYNLLGRNVATLIKGSVVAGRHEVEFDGSQLASGVYFYRMKTNGTTITQKMLLLK